MDKGRLIRNALCVYCLVLIPLLAVSFHVFRDTLYHLEEATHHEIQDKVVRAGNELDELLNNYEGSSISLAKETALVGNVHTDNANRYKAIRLIQSVAQYDMNIDMLFLASKQNDIYSSLGYSSQESFFRKTLQLSDAAVAKMQRLLQAPVKAFAAFEKSNSDNGLILLHYPFSRANTNFSSVNYQFSYAWVASYFTHLLPESRIYICLSFADSTISFIADGGDFEWMKDFPDSSFFRDYTLIQHRFPHVDIQISVYYANDSLYAPVYKGQTASIVILTSGLLASVLLALLFSARRIKGIERLQDAAKGRPVHFRYKDEYAFIGKLISQSASEITRLSSRIRYTRNTLRQQTVRLLLSGAVKHRETANELLQPSGLSLDENYFFVSGVSFKAFASHETLLLEIMRDEPVCMIDDSSKRFLAFIGETPMLDDSQEARIAVARKLQQKLESNGVEGVRIGISQVYQEFGMMELAMREVVEIMHSELNEYRAVLCFEDLMDEHQTVLQIDQYKLQAFREALREWNTVQAEELFEHMHAEILASRCSESNKAYLRYCILQTLIDITEEENNDQEIRSILQINVLDDAEYVLRIQQIFQSMSETMRAKKTVDFERIACYIQEHYTNPTLSSAEVAEFAGIGKAHLAHVFKSNCGLTYIDYVSSLRLTKAQELLEKTEMPIAEIVKQVGYYDHSSFRRKFKSQFGIGMSEYRERMRHKMREPS